VPSYVRTEIKKKTGVTINEFGERLDEIGKSPSEINSIVLNGGSKQSTKEIKIDKNAKFTPITSYKPSGNLIYDQELLNIGRGT
jgi:hypothetical protein